MSSRARALFVLAGALALVYFALPPGSGAESLRVIAPSIGVGAVLMGIATYQPPRTLPWALMAIALACLAASNMVWSTLYFAGDDTFPSLANAFHLAAAILLVAATALLGHDTAAEDSLSGIETMIVSVAVGLGVWLIVIEPFLNDRQVPLGDRVWAVAVPLLDALALAIAIRTAIQVNFRFASAVLVALGLGVQLAADVTRSAQELRGSFGPGGLAAALSVAAPLVIAASALDPTMAFTHSLDEDRQAVGFGRVVWLSVAALTPLTVLLALTLTDLGNQSTRIVAAACAVVVVVLALARMWGLVARCPRTHRTQGAGPPRGDGRAFERRGDAGQRLRADPVRQPRAAQHARTSR